MIKKFIDSVFWQILALAVLVISFFHEAFKMQFWKDDYALLYNLQQKEPFYFPYQHLVDLYAPFFALFGTNPIGYFSLGVLFIFISSVVFYYLVYKLFSKKILAFMASVIYITTPVGIDSVIMMMTFATTYFMLSLFLSALIFLLIFYEDQKIIYYLISLVFLYLSFELIPYRSFYLIGVVMGFEFINLRASISLSPKRAFHFILKNWTRVNYKKNNILSDYKYEHEVRNFILRQLLLLLVWVAVFYIIPVYLLPDVLKYHPQENIGKLYRSIIDYKLLLYPLLTTINIIVGGIPYLFYQNFYIYNIWVSLSSLLLISFLLVYIYLHFRKKEKRLTKIYLFALGFLYITPLAFYAYSSREIMIAANRYLLCSVPAYSLLVICIYVFLFNVFTNNEKLKLLPVFFFLLVFLINSFTTQTYIKDFNRRSYYSTQFSRQMKQFVPHLPKNSLIYFKLDEDANINYRLVDTYRGGHYDERAYFAVLYNLKQEEINPVITDFTVFLDNLKKSSVDEDHVFAFQYTKDGLKDISKETRKSVEQTLSKTIQLRD